jgi:hypothetical protein
MTAALAWIPDPYLPHSDVLARAGDATYRVTSWHPSMTNPGAHTASMGSLDLGRFPYTPEGKRAALMACQSHADYVGAVLQTTAAMPDSADASSLAP